VYTVNFSFWCEETKLGVATLKNETMSKNNTVSESKNRPKNNRPSLRAEMKAFKEKKSGKKVDLHVGGTGEVHVQLEVSQFGFRLCACSSQHPTI
jgi:hypothetical protein